MHCYYIGFPGGSEVKNLPANVGDAGDPGNCAQSLGPEDPLEWESDTTKPLSTGVSTSSGYQVSPPREKCYLSSHFYHYHAVLW